MEKTGDNAFDNRFLHCMADRDQPPTSQADTAGPWRVEPVEGGWGCFVLGEDEPEAVFTRRDLALLAAAALPASGAENRFRLEAGESRPYGVRELSGPVGTVRWWRDDLVSAMNHLAALLARPGDLAHLLEAAGGDTLDRAGRILGARVRAAEDDPGASR